MFSVPYTHHFGLKANPFSIVPDPHYLYMSVQHKEALAHLLYGLGTDGGIVLLTGDAGTGKTTVCRCLLEELPDDVDVACIDEPELTVEGLVAGACSAFGVGTEAQGSVKRHVDRLNTFLLANHARGRRSVLVVDEAQRLSVDVLEQLRLLTNLETPERKLLQILLIGRPELREMLGRSELRQLSQRVVARFHLRPLGCAEVGDYVRRRLALVGGHAHIFPARLARRLHALTKGTPRAINLLCDRALLGASARGQDRVDAAGLARAAQELGLAGIAAHWTSGLPALAIAATVVVAICAAAMVMAGYENYGAAHAAPAAPPQTLPASSAEAGKTAMPVAVPHMLPLPTLELTWPDAATRDRSTALANAALQRRWGVAESGGPMCAARLPDGLRCLRGRAGLAELRAMNLPAVLHLKDDRGRQVDALLLGIDDNAASLLVAGAQHRLGSSALAATWQGDYTLLWRGPPRFDHTLRLGSRGPAVAWLRARLALLRGESRPSRLEQPFDKGLLARVREFQLAQGLDPDGMAGVRTLVRLAARSDPSAPALAHSSP